MLTKVVKISPVNLEKMDDNKSSLNKMVNRLKIVPAVYLIVRKSGKILLLKRHNTGYGDGLFTLPSGHLENDEGLGEAAVREIKEEVGLEIKKDDIKLKLVMQRNEPKQPKYIDFYFLVKNWSGYPKNCEKNKCSQVTWFPESKLPKKTLGHVTKALKNMKKGINYISYNHD